MNIRNLVCLIIPILLSYNGKSQETGCTDPQALNFNPEATINDGSCVYPVTAITPVTVVGSLPVQVIETSGLIYWNGGLWTHNDSGNDARLYKIDTITGEVLQTITISGAENIDWEDIAQDESRIFIGDFGNNFGNRTDLKIYVTEKSAFPASGDGNVAATIVNFSYGDQRSFEMGNRNNDYDCESLIAFYDSLYLFTKNWVNEETRLYGMPKILGTYELYPLDSMNSDGLITGADIIEDGTQVILCGYKNYNPFTWLLFDFQGSSFFSGNKRRIGFSGMLGAQTEGTAYTSGMNVYISSEKTTVSPAKLFRINTSPWTVIFPTGSQGNMNFRHEMQLFPNPNNGNFSVNLGQFCRQDDYRATIINCTGATIIQDCPVELSGCKADLCLPGLENGLYLLKLYSSEHILTSRLLVYQ